MVRRENEGKEIARMVQGIGRAFNAGGNTAGRFAFKMELLEAYGATCE